MAVFRTVGLARAPRLAAHLCAAAAQPKVRTHHDVLGVPPDASPEQIDRAYLALSLHLHPRKWTADHFEESVQRFSAVGEAYDSLVGMIMSGPNTPMHYADLPPFPQPGALVTRRIEPPYDDQLVGEAPYVPPGLARFNEWMRRLPDRWDELLGHTYDSLIHKLLRDDKLVEAFDCFAEMKNEGEKPTASTYELLIRGCTIAMTRVRAEDPTPDRLTAFLYRRVLDLWHEMRERRIRVDRFTYLELLRACGKAGQLEAAFLLFEKMLSLPQFLPDERAFSSMYELCTHNGAYERVFEVFREHQQLRKSLFSPRFTPVAFSHLMLSAVEGGQMHRLPGVLGEMRRFRCYPSGATCAKLLAAALEQGQLDVAQNVIELTQRAGHVPNRILLDAYVEAAENRRIGSAAAVGDPAVSPVAHHQRRQLDRGRADAQ